jgi:hypothetical protein
VEDAVAQGLGGGVGLLAVQGEELDQARRSAASEATVSQAAFTATSREGSRSISALRSLSLFHPK